MKYFIVALFMTLGVFLLSLDTTAVPLSTDQLCGKIGSEFVHAIESADTIKALKLLPKHHKTKEEKQGYNVIPSEREMDEALVRAVKSCILNDEHYYFDMTKKCEFVPEIGFIISGDKEYTVYASYCAKQLKFIDGSHEIIIDCDPMGPLMEKTFERAVRS